MLFTSQASLHWRLNASLSDIVYTTVDFHRNMAREKCSLLETALIVPSGRLNIVESESDKHTGRQASATHFPYQTRFDSMIVRALPFML